MALLTTQDQQIIGNRAKDAIIARTRAGVSLDGSRFEPKETGAPSNLVDTGRLMNSFQVRVVSDYEVVVANTAPYASYVDEDRPFMGLTEKEEEDLADLIEGLVSQNIEERINELLNRTR